MTHFIAAYIVYIGGGVILAGWSIACVRVGMWWAKRQRMTHWRKYLESVERGQT